MIDPSIGITLFDRILATLGLLREGKKRRTEKIDNALFALSTALTETRAYIADRENGKRRNRKREFDIARLWHAAAIPLRVIDKRFAARCFLKGSYWMQPDTWEKNRIKQSGIAIDQVYKETRELLLRN